MAAPRLHINVEPSSYYVKSHYIATGFIATRFHTSMPIDCAEFRELTPEMRSLVFAQFEDNGSLIPEITIDLITNEKLATVRAIVQAVVELLARDHQAILDQLAMDWNAAVVQFADPDPDPGF